MLWLTKTLQRCRSSEKTTRFPRVWMRAPQPLAQVQRLLPRQQLSRRYQCPPIFSRGPPLSTRGSEQSTGIKAARTVNKLRCK
ncbi:unnamed protein product, partial [Iphiclides podalirius]